jgi:hypothetical protein
VLYFNARSVCNKLLELYDVLSGSSDGTICDIISISETWLSDKLQNPLILAGHPFSLLTCDRSAKTGGGCALLIHNRRHHSEIVFPQNISLADVQMVGAEIFAGNRVYAVFCVYNPPGFLSHCVNVLNDAFNVMCSRYHSVIFTGDFNLPDFAECLDSGLTCDARCMSFANTLLQYGLEQLVHEPG